MSRIKMNDIFLMRRGGRWMAMGLAAALTLTTFFWATDATRADDAATGASLLSTVEQTGLAPSVEPSQSLEERWRRAAAQRSSSTPTWIGYGFSRSMGQDEWFIAMPNGSEEILSIHNTDRGRPAPMVDKQVAVLMLVAPRGTAEGMESVLAVGATNLEMDFDLDGHPLLWLGDAEVAESVSFLKDAMPLISKGSARRDVVTSLAAHGEAAEQAVLEVVERHGARQTEDEVELEGEALEALAAIGSDMGVARLTEIAVGSEHAELRRTAAEALGGRSEPEVVEVLSRMATEDESDEVRQTAVEALGQKMDDVRREALASLLTSASDPLVRSEAGAVLASTFADERTSAVLAQRAFAETDRDVRVELVVALSEMDGRAGSGALRRIAESHPDQRLRDEARQALHEGG